MTALRSVTVAFAVSMLASAPLAAQAGASPDPVHPYAYVASSDDAAWASPHRFFESYGRGAAVAPIGLGSTLRVRKLDTSVAYPVRLSAAAVRAFEDTAAVRAVRMLP